MIELIDKIALLYNLKQLIYHRHQTDSNRSVDIKLAWICQQLIGIQFMVWFLLDYDLNVHKKKKKWSLRL